MVNPTATSSFESKDVTYQPGVITDTGNVEVPFQLLQHFSAADVSNSKAVFIDAITLLRERVVPVVESDSLAGSSLDVGVATMVSLYNTGNTDSRTNYNGDSLRTYFDADILIEATNATVGDITWVSDNQVNVMLTATSAGDVDLTLTNVYSDAVQTWSVNAVPEPATMALLGWAA